MQPGKDVREVAKEVVSTMTCKSCYWSTSRHCSKKLPDWPRRGPFDCSQFVYEPGTDEDE